MNIIFFFDIRYIFLWLNICLSFYAYNNNIYYKNKLDRIYYSLMWFLLKLYSRIELIYNKLKQTDVKNVTIKLIKNGDIVEIYDNDSLKMYDNQEFNFLEKTFSNNDMVMGEYNDGENIKVVRYNNNINLNSDYYIKSDVKLLGIQVKIMNNNELKETLPLLFDKNHNYFIENNILFDRKFINYFLKKEKNSILSSDDKYEVIFFDNDINIHTITEPQYIRINKKNFEIMKETDKFEIIDNIIDKENDNKINNLKTNIINFVKNINWVGPIYAGQCDDEDY